MATYDELVEATLKAHSAGDTANAQIFADMAKELKLSSGIPGQVVRPAEAGPSIRDRISGVLEAPAVIASGLVSGPASALAGLYGGLTSGQYGTPAGVQAGEEMARRTQAQFYQPRTETGQQIGAGISEFLGPLAGVPVGKMTAAGILAPGAVNQLATAAAPYAARAVAPIQNALARPPQPQMSGMGAATTNAAMLRQERAQRLGIPLTKGEQAPELGLQQFESDIAKAQPEGVGKPLIQFKEQQKSAILDKFEQMAGETGAEYADPSAYKKIGSIVDKALTTEFDKKKAAFKAAYDIADNSGETLQQVPYQSISDYINNQSPTVRSKLAPIIDAVNEQLALNDPNKTGTMSVRALEDIYQQIGANTQQGTPNAVHARQLKLLIDKATENAGGDLYKNARRLRTEFANDFENTYRVAKLLGTRGGYADRAVALGDVFDHVVLDGSLEEMQTVTKLLEKGGPEGRQAYAELQGQTIQHLKDQLTKNASGQLSFAKLNTAINALDQEDKLTYMFGKTGRDTLVDLRDTLRDALVKDPRAINYSNTGTLVNKALDKLAQLRVPLAKTAADFAEKRALTKKVQESVGFNALAPNATSTNALAP